MSSNKPRPTLMYDKLYRRAVQCDTLFRNWERNFRDLPVYDFTSVASLIGSVNVDGIPKRMPHDNMWAEWDNGVQRFGVVVGGDNKPDADELTYCCAVFAATPHDQQGSEIGTYISPYYIKIANDHSVVIGSLHDRFGTINPLLGGPMISKLDDEKVIADVVLWPLLCAMALLSCRNIVADEVRQSGTHRKLRKGVEDRPWATYKVLKLEMPSHVVQRQPSESGITDSDDGGPKVRFHLCRGHFKNLTHARYKNARGLHWWPAHWKGSIELGRVDKRYEGKPSIENQ